MSELRGEAQCEAVGAGGISAPAVRQILDKVAVAIRSGQAQTDVDKAVFRQAVIIVVVRFFTRLSQASALCQRR